METNPKGNKYTFNIIVPLNVGQVKIIIKNIGKQPTVKMNPPPKCTS